MAKVTNAHVLLFQGDLAPPDQVQDCHAHKAELSIQGMKLVFDPPNAFRFLYQPTGEAISMTWAYSHVPFISSNDTTHTVWLYYDNGLINNHLKFFVEGPGPRVYKISRTEIWETTCLGSDTYELQITGPTSSSFTHIPPKPNARRREKTPPGELQFCFAADQAWRAGVLIHTLLHGQVSVNGAFPMYEIAKTSRNAPVSRSASSSSSAPASSSAPVSRNAPVSRKVSVSRSAPAPNRAPVSSSSPFSRNATVSRSPPAHSLAPAFGHAPVSGSAQTREKSQARCNDRARGKAQSSGNNQLRGNGRARGNGHDRGIARPRASSPADDNAPAHLQPQYPALADPTSADFSLLYPPPNLKEQNPDSPYPEEPSQESVIPYFPRNGDY